MLNKVKTSDLTSTALDWAVAKCEGGTDFGTDGITHGFKLHGRIKVLASGWALTMSYHPSTNWEQGGSIIEREGIAIGRATKQWAAFINEDDDNGVLGNTPLIAAMRCYVASKLGDIVEIPVELMKG